MAQTGEEMKETETVLILVHPGSLLGSADFNLGREEAEEVRMEIREELWQHIGPIVLVKGELCDELPESTLGLEIDSVGIDMRLEAGPDEYALAAVADHIAAEYPGARFIVTGAWADEDSGCVTCVATRLEQAGRRVSVSPHAPALP
jgi:hypothetical protein